MDIMAVKHPNLLFEERNEPAAGSPQQSEPQQNPTYDDHAAKLEYMREMLLEFRKLADGLGENTLVYLIEVTVLEVDECAKTHKFKSELNA